jgi:PAS domain S-box-containing protein
MPIAVATNADVIIRVATKVDLVGSAVIATDTNGTIVFWNATAETLLGWSSGDVVGRNIVDVTRGQQSAAEAESIMRDLLNGKTWSGPFLVRHRDGTPILLHVTDIPVFSERSVVGIVGVSRRA